MDFEFFIVPLLVIIVVVLLLREINCWYWKINALLNACEKTNEKLDSLIILAGANTKSPSVTATPQDFSPTRPPPSIEPDEEPPEDLTCPQCSRSISLSELRIGDNGLTKCPHCKGYFEVEQE